MEDITDYFDSLLATYKTVDIANDEFKKRLSEDADLKQAYREWCHDVGSTERNGFLDYCEEYLSSQDSIMNNLKDFYEDE